MKAQFERLLTRIPMYLLVNGGLCSLAVIALIYSSLGLTGFGPFELAVTSLLFTGVSIGTSYLFGRILRIHAHLQSALISGLILALIFTPTFDLVTLAEYAIIAVIAMASKFIVAPRSRHVFNPAAFGAFVGALLLQQFPSWWIGSPTFVAVVAIVSFAVLYKTRQLLMGSLFVVASTVIITVAGLLHGETFPGVTITALASWPIIFIAGIMLSEPLTLPPRQWQRFALAGIVAIVTSLPFHIGWFNSSPAFALLVGNLFALGIAWRQRRGLRLTLAERRTIAPNVKEFVFSSAKPLEFNAGQFVELTLPHPQQDLRGVRRSFSITSRPGEQQLRLAIKFYDPSSTFKQALLELLNGAVVQATGINGDFTLPDNPRTKLLFIAGGIGITPFISHLRLLAGRKVDVVVLYFNRRPEDTAYKSFLDESVAKVRYFVSQKAGGEFIEEKRLTQDVLQTYIRDLSEREVYISGPPAMVARAKKIIGRSAKRVHTDYFSGY